MSLFVYLNGTNVATSNVRLRANGDQGAGVAQAADGTMSQGAIVFDDSTGTLDVRGWMAVAVDEPDCTSRRLFTGYVGDRTYRRGHYLLSGGREIDTTINDANILLQMHRINGSDSLRPAETDTARLTWLLGSGYIPRVTDLGLVNGAGRLFDATQYKGQLPSDVLNDLCGPRGQIFFVYWDQTAQSLGLFFDAPTATTFTSTLTISDVLADNGATCFPPNLDDTGLIDPSEVYSNIRYVYKGGVVYDANAITASTFFSAGYLGHRDTEVTNDRVGLKATADLFADRILTRDSTEAVILNLTVRLPAAKVGLIQAGMRLGVRLTFVPGFETLAYTRVEQATYAQTDGTPDFYDVGLRLSTHGIVGGGGTGGGSTLPFPISGGTAPGFVQHNYGNDVVVLPSTPTPGNMLLVMGNDRVLDGGLAAPTGWTKVVGADMLTGTTPSHGSEAFYRVCQAGDTATSPLFSGLNFDFSEWLPCTVGAHLAASNGLAATIPCGGTFTPAQANAVLVGVFGVGAFDSLTWAITASAGTTELVGAAHAFPFPGGNTPWGFVGYKTVTSTAATTVGAAVTNSAGDPTRNLYSGITLELLPATGAAAEPPMPGTPSAVPETPTPAADGVTVLFTTQHPYAASSLVVFYNGSEVTGDITETDPTAGTFTFQTAPRAGSEIDVLYVSA